MFLVLKLITFQTFIDLIIPLSVQAINMLDFVDY